MKRRSLTVLLCLLAIISLASVGFASWVISAGDTEEATGSITVHDVSDERLEIIEVKIDGKEPADASFVFGKSSEGTEKWLKNDILEKLTLKLKFKVVLKETKAGVTDAQITISFGPNTGTDFGKWIKVANDGKVTATHTGDGVYECDLVLQWGSTWGDGVNPFTYYNGKNANDAEYYYLTSDPNKEALKSIPEGADAKLYTKVTCADDANEKLGDMFEALKAAKFKVVINAEPASTTQG